MKKLTAILLTAMLLLPCLALGEIISLNGSVVSVETRKAVFPMGGTVANVTVAAGQRVSKGQTLAELDTVKVYAQESGTVHFFGEPGDSTESVAAKYGAVAYIEPDWHYSISASSKNSADNEAARTAHPGERVYLRCNFDGKHTGTGFITQITGTSFTVAVDSGAFITGESILVYRDENCTSAQRLGKGGIAQNDPIAYAGEGSIVRFCAEEGSHVEKGAPLFETLPGTFDGLKMTGSEVLCPADGVLFAVSAAQGDTVEKGAALAEIYPDSGMRVSVKVPETDLRSMAVGQQVTVEFLYAGDVLLTRDGTVESISFIAAEKAADDESDEASYEALIAFEPDPAVRYGMKAMVSTKE